jgi:hypothetical protein
MVDDSAIQAAFEFTAEDLAANKQGRLSETQLKTGLPRQLKIAVASTIADIIILTVALIYFWDSTLWRLTAFLAGGGLITFAWVVRKRYKRYQEAVAKSKLLAQGQLKSIGPIHRHQVNGIYLGGAAHRTIRSGDIILPLTHWEYNALRDDTAYRFYYWEWPNQKGEPIRAILAVETLDPI